MSMIPSTVTLTNLERDLGSCGIALPRAAREWTDRRDILTAALVADPVEDIHAEAEAITAKTVTATIERLTRQRLEAAERRSVVNALIEAVCGAAARAIRAGADDILAAVRPAFDQAVATLKEHAGAYAPDEPGETVLARGQQTAWTAIRDASAALDSYLVLWSTVYGMPASTDSVVETYGGDWWARVDAAEAFKQPNRWHSLVVAGTPLHLNDYAQSLRLEDETPFRPLRSEAVIENGFRFAKQSR